MWTKQRLLGFCFETEREAVSISGSWFDWIGLDGGISGRAHGLVGWAVLVLYQYYIYSQVGGHAVSLLL